MDPLPRYDKSAEDVFIHNLVSVNKSIVGYNKYLLVINIVDVVFVAFRVSRRRCEMYIGHARLCVCLSLATFPHYCMDLNVPGNLGEW